MENKWKEFKEIHKNNIKLFIFFSFFFLFIFFSLNSVFSLEFMGKHSLDKMSFLLFILCQAFIE